MQTFTKDEIIRMLSDGDLFAEGTQVETTDQGEILGFVSYLRHYLNDEDARDILCQEGLDELIDF